MSGRENDMLKLLSPDTDTNVTSLRRTYSQLLAAGLDVHCDDCGSRPNPPDGFVAVLPRPWASTPRLQCHRCWARETAIETELEAGQARVLAAQYAGFDPPEIARAHGGVRVDAREMLRELNDRCREADESTVTGELLAQMLSQ